MLFIKPIYIKYINIYKPIYRKSILLGLYKSHGFYSLFIYKINITTIPTMFTLILLVWFTLIFLILHSCHSH